MPGKKLSDFQVLEYKKRRRSRTQVAAAASVGISERSARRIEAGRELPSQEPPRHWRTRADPFEAVWEAELLPLLAVNRHLNGATLFEELMRRRPEEYLPGQLRTIQRRVRAWRATHGAERMVFFAQEHPPGRQGLSDFTVTDDLGVTIGGAAFPHRLYQFALAHSGWRHSMVVEGGETFAALSSGLQEALWHLWRRAGRTSHRRRGELPLLIWSGPFVAWKPLLDGACVSASYKGERSGCNS